MLLQSSDNPLLPGEVNPYVSAVIHLRWDLLSEFFVWAQKMDQDSRGLMHMNGVHSIKGAEIFQLGLVSCSYFIQSKGLTIYVMRDGHGHMPGFTLWNGILDKKNFEGWPVEDMLHDLRRVYSAVAQTANMCSTAVHSPNGHDVADAIAIERMIHSWH